MVCRSMPATCYAMGAGFRTRDLSRVKRLLPDRHVAEILIAKRNVLSAGR